MSAEGGVTLATLDARLRAIESLLRTLVDALSEEEGESEEEGTDLEGAPMSRKRNAQEPL